MFKTYTCLSLALLALAAVSSAHSAVLLEKVSYAGFVMPSYAITKSCTINDNGQLIMDYKLAGMNSKRTIAMQINSSVIKDTIVQAQAGKITTAIFPVDAATVMYRAYYKQSNGSTKTVSLYEENGGTGQLKTNTSQAAQTLKNFINLNCGDAL
jgi:hypothetical protein